MNMQMARTLPLAAAMTATAFVLAGCTGGSGSGAPPPMAASASATTRHPSNRPFADLGGLVHWQPNRARSWMSPDANSQTLLYVSDIATGSVQVFAYPKGTLEGTLTGFGYPQGECADSSGNVYIADAGNDVVVEYAHGGTSPIATLNDPNAYPASCAVDPASGNVAVANLLTAQNFNAGTVAIYPPGSSNATATYADPSIVREYFLAYDLSGKIYVAGVSGKSGKFVYATVAPDGTFTDIPITGGTLGFPGGVQRYGSDMAVGDQQGSVVGKPDIYRIASTGKIGGKTSLITPTGGRLVDPVQFVIVPKNANKNYILTADAIGGAVYINGFPNGKASTSYTSGLLQPLGIALSEPPSH